MITMYTHSIWEALGISMMAGLIVTLCIENARLMIEIWRAKEQKLSLNKIPKSGHDRLIEQYRNKGGVYESK